MTLIDNFFGKVGVAVQVGLVEVSVAAALDAEGYGSSELQLIKGLIVPGEKAYQYVRKIEADLDQATQRLETNLAFVKKEIAALRRSMTNNLPARSPLFKAIGIKEAQPRKQEALLEYGQGVFASGSALSDADAALLAKRKWDKPRFAAALQAVKDAVAANIDQETAKGASIAATAALYDRIDELDAAFRPFAKDARNILKDLPGELTKMGLKSGVPEKPRRPVASKARKPIKPPAA